jgi:NADH-quinone oxidoreductase subunit B
VDVYTPGCPPGPETLIHSIITLHEKIRRGEITRRRAESGAGAGVYLGQVLPSLLRGRSSAPARAKEMRQ